MDWLRENWIWLAGTGGLAMLVVLLSFLRLFIWPKRVILQEILGVPKVERTYHHVGTPQQYLEVVVKVRVRYRFDLRRGGFIVMTGELYSKEAGLIQLSEYREGIAGLGEHTGIFVLGPTIPEFGQIERVGPESWRFRAKFGVSGRSLLTIFNQALEWAPSVEVQD